VTTLVDPLPQQLAQHAVEHPDRTFMDDVGGRHYSYADADFAGRRWAAAFRALGIGRGEFVASFLPTSCECVFAWTGLGWLAAVDVPINRDFRGRMLTHVLNTCGAATLLLAPRFLERVLAVAKHLQHLKRLVIVRVPGDECVDVDGTNSSFELVELESVLRSVGPVPPEDGPMIHDIATVVFTSGTTGPSKGVLMPWGQYQAMLDRGWPMHLLSADDAFYQPYPFFHVGGKGTLYAAVATGGRLVIREVFSATEFWTDVRRFRVTICVLFPALARYLYNQPAGDDDAQNPLRVVLMCPVMDEYEDFQKRFGLKITTTYNMTEISSPISAFEVVDPRCSGQVVPGCEVMIVDEFDNEVPAGTPGELLVRSRTPWTMMAGYLGEPARTAEAWRNLWFHTGDAFVCDEAGNYFFKDRMKDTIRRRAENISSMEVEAELVSHPAVHAAAVIGVPAEFGDEEVLAFVVPDETAGLTERDLIDFLDSRLPKFMIPRYVKFLTALPMTPSGKIQKHRLKDDAAIAGAWDRSAAPELDGRGGGGSRQ
jgi:crotonobetaine/carnitine-CoA ligase